MDPSVPIAIAVVVMLAGVIIWLVYYFDRKRSEAMEQIAAQLGLSFMKQADSVTADVQGRFNLFSYGRSRKAKNAIYGESNGTGVWIFDYQYTTGSGKNQSTHSQTVACLASSQLNLPRFQLYREGMLSRIGAGVFGMQDIDFESHPAFSKRYVLKGESEEEIRDAFTASVLSFFELQDRNLRVEGDRDQLLVYRAHKKVAPDKVQDLLTEGFGIFREFQS